jgi:hypothetical protein
MRQIRFTLLATAVAWVVLAAMTPGQTVGGQTIAGSWRAYSERLFYDRGGAGTTITAVSTRLEILPNGTWTFGSANGKWRIAPIAGSDWKRWGTKPYGPTRRAVFEGWHDGTADGPIEEEPGRVNFVWVIYHADPPVVRAPGTVQMKFGR